MTSAFDDLIERLLYDVALAGDSGLGIQQLANATHTFYSESTVTSGTQPPAGEDILFSDAPPENQPVVDSALVELVWQWVSIHPEVEVRQQSGECDTVGGAQENEPDAQKAIALPSDLVARYAGKTLTTGEERIWIAITGHGVDPKRIPPLEFECLKCIASHGPSGVVQPDVTKETGQDKRSVPKRTDSLVRGGYVTKSSVIARGAKTSLLRLMKFANEQSLPKDDEVRKGASIIQYNVWFDEAMRLMKDNDGIIAFEDLRGGLGIAGKRFETKALHRCIRRLAHAGLLRKLRAREDSEMQIPGAPVKTVRSLQLIRDPVEQDKTSFMGKDWSRNKRVQRPVDSRDFGQSFLDRHEANADEDAADDDVDADFELDDEAEDGCLHPSHIAPAWNREKPFVNFLFDKIAEAGQRGITSAEMYEKATGQFWKRAMDEMLAKMTDMWQHSQPPHLRHFTVVKDTSMSQKQPVFRFRSHENFQKAVDEGETSWDQVLNSGRNTGKKRKDVNFNVSPDLDEWGFPRLSPQLFVGQPGSATLQECRNVTPRTTDGLRVVPAPKKVSRKTLTPKSNARPRPSLTGNGSATPKAVAKEATLPSLERRQTLTKVQQQKLDAEETQYSRSVRALAERKIRAEMAHAQPLGSQQDGAAGLSETTQTQTAGPNDEEADVQPAIGKVNSTAVPPEAIPIAVKPRCKSAKQRLGASAEEVNDAIEAAQTPEAATSNTPKGLQTTPSNASNLPKKKRGRPSKADIAERERLQREAEAQAEEDARAAARIVQTKKRKAPDAVAAAVDEAPPPKKKRGRKSKAELLRLETERQKLAGDSQEASRDTQDSSALPQPGQTADGSSGTGVLETSAHGSLDKADSQPPVPAGLMIVKPYQIRDQTASKSAPDDFETRVKALEAELRAGSKPGVHFNLPRASRLKAEAFEWHGRGRRPKALIAVFKLSSLKDLSWFTDRAVVDKMPTNEPNEDLNDRAGGQTPSNVDKAVTGHRSQDEETAATLYEAPVQPPSIEPRQPEPDPVDWTDSRMANSEVEYPVELDDQTEADTSMAPAINGAAQTPAEEPIEEVAAPTHDEIPPNEPLATRPAKDPSTPKRVEKVTASEHALDPSLRPYEDITMDDAAEINPTQNDVSPKKRKHYDSASETFRKKTIMDLLHDNDGMFPAGRPLMCAFTSRWRTQSDTNPDERTIESTTKNLTTSGKIKKIAFNFKGRDGHVLTRWMYTLREVASNSAKVFALQKAIGDAYPAYAMPERAFEALAPDIKAQLDNQTQVTRSTNGGPAKLVPKDLPHLWPHYEDDFPKDLTVTVKRTNAKPAGFAPTEADIQKFRNARKEKATDAAQKRRVGRPRLPDSEHELDEDEFLISQEQSAMQGEIQLSSYQHEPQVPVRRHPHARISRSFKFSEYSGPPPRLPGRVLKRKAAEVFDVDHLDHEALRAQALKAATSCLSSQAAHTQVNPEWLANAVSGNLETHSTFTHPSGTGDATTAYPPLKRRSVGARPVSNAPVRPRSSEEVPDREGDRIFARPQVARPLTGTSFGVLVPGEPSLSVPYHGSHGIDADQLPQSLRDILEAANGYARDLGSNPNEATSFFDEVERVEAWEKSAIKTNKAFVRSQAQPYINYTTPSIPGNLAKRVRFADEAQDVNEPVSSFPQNKVTAPRQSKKRPREEGQEPTADSNPPPAKYRYKSRKEHPVPARIREDLDAAGASPKTKKRDRRSAILFTDQDYDRLTKAVALMGAVAGGLAGRQNWYIVAHILSYRYDSEFLRHRWDKVRKERDDLVKQMQERIWDPFLEAYERGALPHVDFTTLRNTDWPALLEWVENEVLTNDCFEIVATAKTVPDLPLSSKELTSNYDVEESDRLVGPDRDAFFTTLTEKMRQDVASTLLNGDAMKANTSAESRCEPGHMLLRSWIRAIALTEDVKYDAELAHQKITQFDDEIVAAVCDQMTAEKYVHEKKKGRRLPGRNLDMVDDVFRQFRRWPGKEIEYQYLPNIAAKRSEILDILRREDQYPLSYAAGDEEILVLTNMVAQGLLTISSKIPERNDDFDAPYPRISVWGYNGPNYNARMFDKTRLRFTIVYEKSPTFSYDHGLRNDVPIPTEPPLYEDEVDLRRPIWVDIHGNLLPQMFEAIMRSVLHLLVFRPGVTALEIEAIHKQRLWVWEIELLMPWMEAMGLAIRVEPESGREIDGVWKGGWRAGEWWYCALCDDVASNWKEAVEEPELVEEPEEVMGELAVGE